MNTDGLDHTASPVRNRFASRVTAWAHRTPSEPHPLYWLQFLVRVVFIVIQEMKINRLSLRAGALTYALLLSMVPLLAMSTAVVKGLGGDDQVRTIVFSYLDTLAEAAPESPEPQDGVSRQEIDRTAQTATNLTSHLKDAAERIFAYVDRTSFATLGTFGMLGVFLSVILVLGQIEAAMNDIWHVKDSRSVLRKIADYLTLMVLLPIAVNVALAAGTILTSPTLGLYLDRIIPLQWAQSLLLRGIPILFLTAALYVAYLFFPNTKVKTTPTLIGALIAASVWFALQNLFIRLQIGVANYNAIYGSFATIPLFLVWIYFGWLFVLLGAQVAYAMQHNRSHRLFAERDEPSLCLSAAFDIYHQVAGRFTTGRGTTVEDLLAALNSYPPTVIETARDRLIEAGAIHHSRENGMLMLSGPLETFDHRRIITAVLGSKHPQTPGGSYAERIIVAAADTPPLDDERRQDELEGR